MIKVFRNGKKKMDFPESFSTKNGEKQITQGKSKHHVSLSELSTSEQQVSFLRKKNEVSQGRFT